MMQKGPTPNCFKNKDIAYETGFKIIEANDAVRANGIVCGVM